MIFLLFLAVILNISYFEYKHFDFSHSIDAKSYLAMSQGDYNVTVTHRYRFIVPVLAGGIANIFRPLHELVWPNESANEMASRLAFYLINNLIFSLAFLFIFKLCLLYEIRFSTALIAVLMVIVNRTVVLCAGIPYTDSLYLLCIAVLFFGIKAKSSLSIVFAILLGPIAKESFFLLMPIALYFGFQILGGLKTGTLLLLTLMLFFGSRYFIDLNLQANQAESVQNVKDHVGWLLETTSVLFSVNGIGQMVGSFGLFGLLIVFSFLGKGKPWSVWLNKIEWYWWVFLVIIFFHVLLSGDISRMLYFSAPLIALIYGLILQHKIIPALNPGANAN